MRPMETSSRRCRDAPPPAIIPIPRRCRGPCQLDQIREAWTKFPVTPVSPREPSAQHHQRSSFLRPSINSLLERVVVEVVRVLAKASTTVSRISSSINLLSPSLASTNLFRSLLLTTCVQTVCTQVEMTPQWVDLDLASATQHCKTHARSQSRSRSFGRL